ncbi:transposase, partial [Bacillaceae bacterium S4-13-56]
MTVDHDRLFKELISTFFEEFMLLFFPDVYEEIDFRQVKFLSQEVYTDVIVGEKYKVDILVETKLKGEDGLVNIHVEPQSYHQEEFNERMFIYFSRLFEKYRRKILPIALFSYDFIKNEPNNFSMTFSAQPILDFNYLTIELKKEDWRNYLRKYNPVAAALLSKMGYNESEKVEVKKEFFRILIRLELDQARASLITWFFETYLQLNDEQEE